MLSPSENGVSVEPTRSADVQTVALERLLQDGESIILAIKPSSWFVLLVSLPVLLIAVGLGSGAYLADRLFGYESIPLKLMGLALSFISLTRIMVASFQWLGRLYVLTNRRAILIRGIMRINVMQCPLVDIAETILTASNAERPLAIESLYFRTNEKKREPIIWLYLSEPAKIQQTVEQAIRQAKRNSF